VPNAQVVFDIPVRPGMPVPRQHEITIDTTGTDFTLRIPNTGNRVFVTGIRMLSGTAANITWKRGSVSLPPMSFATGTGEVSVNDTGFLFSTDAGQDLKMNSDAAINLAVFTVEAKQWGVF
jgi:hypothetical protein